MAKHNNVGKLRPTTAINMSKLITVVKLQTNVAKPIPFVELEANIENPTGASTISKCSIVPSNNIPASIGSTVLIKTVIPPGIVLGERARRLRLTQRSMEAASTVFDTAELLELILSNLRLNDLFFRVPLTCRGFKNSVYSSPSIRKGISGATALDFHLPKTWCTSDENLWSRCLTVTLGGHITTLKFDFSELSYGKPQASSSFRSVRLSEEAIKRLVSSRRLHGFPEVFYIVGMHTHWAIVEVDIVVDHFLSLLKIV